MSLSICKICKEPIWNFLCLDCLEEDIKRWMPTEHLGGFLSFHRDFLNHFITPADATFDACLRCRSLREAGVCAFCYLNEFVSWVRHLDTGLTEKLQNSFIFSFERRGEFDGFFRNTRLQPVTHVICEREGFGICDGCGEYSDELGNDNGRWVCPDCKEE